MAGRSRKNIGGLATRRRRKVWIGVSAGLVVVVAAAATALVIVKPWTEEFRHGGLKIAAAPAPQAPSPRLSAASSTAPAPSQTGLASALAQVVANPDLGAFSGSVTDAATGTVLWKKDSDKAIIPASTTKVLTGAAALLVLPADHRITTKVVSSPDSNELVLVGAGDPTLTAQANGKGYYPDGPKLSDLVSQVQSSGRTFGSVVVDTSAYAGPSQAPGWDPADIAGGSWAPIEPVMLEGGRLNPMVEYSPRTPTPALDAGRRLALALGIDPAKVHAGKAPAGATPVAQVQSAPLWERLTQMMTDSDDVVAEAIGREIAAATGGPPSFAGAAQAVLTALNAAGFDTAGTVLRDTSGLSTDDRIPSRLLDKIVAQAAAGPQGVAPANGTPSATVVSTGGSPSSGNPLGPLLDYLPVAGGTGSLAYRYTTPPSNVAAGWARAKTGTLSVSNALAGYVLDKDGRVLTFALMSNDKPQDASRAALDAVTATLRNCGCS
ncbi:D-alanyl-D-alanine carboxypeptidase/D-alanyl-D-alanine-endopeptidase (penicillin-binding protein 4) [Nocardia sp. GAS34]|uniref:D-alanyl-D-alanine carboxypeptidase/D-alanyl-D-alanine endopeptidase n=1 Tax=unclassified Nocardia TaxID=2637762 RepID=UPI003D1C61D6